MLGMIAHFAATRPVLYLFCTGAIYIAFALIFPQPLDVLTMLAWTLYRCRVYAPAVKEQWQGVARHSAKRGVIKYRQSQAPSPRQGSTTYQERLAGDEGHR